MEHLDADMSRHIQASARRKNVLSTSGARFVAIVVLCLAALYAVLIIWHGKMQQGITGVMKFIGNPEGMSVIVAMIIIVGGGMFVKSLRRILSEMSTLKERCYQNLNQNEDPKKCYSWLKEQNKKHTLIYRRLDVLMAELKGTRGEKKLPAMADLHEITLQRELSHWDSAGLNTIISFLLILGIMGTLTGVHKVLADDIKVSVLAQALSPSALAVFGTVVLMICRALYLRLVDSYLGVLDEVTMKYILPCLSSQKTQSASGEKWKNLAENLKGMEALEVPIFPGDAGREQRWNIVEETRRNAEVQVVNVAETDKLKKPVAPEVPLRPAPPIKPLVSTAVLPRLSMERIRQGEELCKQNECKLRI